MRCPLWFIDTELALHMKTLEPAAPEGDVGVVVARFQTDNLTEGQIQLLHTVQERHPKVVVFLGISPLMGTRNNPLDFQSRKLMIEAAFPEIIVLYINDVNNDLAWSRNLDEQIASVAKGQKVVLYGSRDSFIPHYRGRNSTVELNASMNMSATDVRRHVASHVKDSPDFRKGAIWQAYNAFPTSFSTVDVAVLNEDGTQVLIGKKPHEILWRFPGGFTDVGSDSDEEDARREVMEETNVEIADLRYLFSMKMRDWRYRGEVDCCRTHFFTAKYVYGAPTAGDDLDKVKWERIEDLSPDSFVPGHDELFKRFLTFQTLTKLTQA